MTPHDPSHVPLARGLAGAAAVLLTLSLAGCGTARTDGDATRAAAYVSSLRVTDPWVRAADSGMTSAFGTVVNDGAEDVVVTGVSTEVSPVTELHETVGDGSSGGAMQMQEVDGGFTVPAGGELALTPGGDHLMLMDLQRPLRPGEQVGLVLELEGGGTTELTAVVKDFSGADEEYVAGHGS